MVQSRVKYCCVGTVVVVTDEASPELGTRATFTKTMTSIVATIAKKKIVRSMRPIASSLTLYRLRAAICLDDMKCGKVTEIPLHLPENTYNFVPLISRRAANPPLVRQGRTVFDILQASTFTANPCL